MGGKPIELKSRPKKVFPICLVADHYPALNIQAQEFLKFETSDSIMAPVVADVFALDVIVEMLSSPLPFLNYLTLKAKFGHKVFALHELTLLAYHLKQNLWIQPDHDMVYFDDTIAADLDVAMAVRRQGVPGNPTPDGILTRLQKTKIGQLLREIEGHPDDIRVDLGLLLLQFSEDTIISMSNVMTTLANSAKADLKNHDAVFGFSDPSTGITIHCNNYPVEQAVGELKAHCQLRKYSEKADSWFGLVISPHDCSSRLVAKLEFPWEHDEKLDELQKKFPKADSMQNASRQHKSKIGRNEPCPCGSGQKYKKCCLTK